LLWSLIETELLERVVPFEDPDLSGSVTGSRIIEFVLEASLGQKRFKSANWHRIIHGGKRTELLAQLGLIGCKRLFGRLEADDYKLANRVRSPWTAGVPGSGAATGAARSGA
jgi:hypothetical protein